MSLKKDKAGTDYFVHRLTDGPRRAFPQPPPAAPTVVKAEPQILHDVYAALLARLPLCPMHRSNLLSRGLDVEAIERGWYKTLPVNGRARIARELFERFGDVVQTVPGIVTKQGERSSYLTIAGSTGLLIPCRNLDGQIVALKVRRDEVKEGESRYLYISSTKHNGHGPGAPVHIPRGTPLKAELVRVTEGELKADAAWHLDPKKIPTLSIAGVRLWASVLPVLEAMEVRTVRLAFDQDARENRDVADCLKRLAGAVTGHGLALEVEVWADG